MWKYSGECEDKVNCSERKQEDEGKSSSLSITERPDFGSQDEGQVTGGLRQSCHRQHGDSVPANISQSENETRRQRHVSRAEIIRAQSCNTIGESSRSTPC